MLLKTDDRYVPIQGFAPNGGTSLTGTITPTTTVCVKLANDVTITIDSIPLYYSAGDGLVLVPGVAYTFSTSVNAHIMGTL